ncbi:DUF1851 domain-containing protein [Rhizobium sp. TH2]|uniref:DUF1851 domain-containing protein n=1 Tax=Rhizobium sp. TH2 TaxID=2775403 RepID=UPI0021577053|nr:DUF1851 domain-containing protein [Rhizobium sp. TH2]UVC10164.1 DUF1851 domain-containing protein [Rhizobium sp. TH2]
MFPVFRANYSKDPWQRASGAEMAGTPAIAGLPDFFREFGGASFGEGIYRVIIPAEMEDWRGRLKLAFPAHQDAIPFAYDWLGRLFVLEQDRLVDGEPAVVMLEPGTGEALEVPSNLRTFHEVELIDDHDAALASKFFEAWRTEGNPAPKYDECAGYKVPLFLGGADDLTNLELSNIDVYWHIMGLIIEKI